MGILKRDNSEYIDRLDFSSNHEKTSRKQLLDLFKSNPIPENQIIENLGLFLNSKTFSRLLFLSHFYQLGLNVPGQVFDFGTRWGQNMTIFVSLRNIFEPFNRTRKIVGFDTFTGFPEIHSKDGNSILNNVGNLTTVSSYQEYLQRILESFEDDSPLSHLRNFEICEGNIVQTLPNYLEANKHTIVSHAFFDMDLYEPTYVALENIWPRMPKGAVLAFDELNDVDSPGETLALLESLGISNIRLQKLSFANRISFFIKD